MTNRSPSQTPRGRGNKQNQTSANRTNARKALRLALSSSSEVITMLKGPKPTRLPGEHRLSKFNHLLLRVNLLDE